MINYNQIFTLFCNASVTPRMTKKAGGRSRPPGCEPISMLPN
nr:MAG TPA: hypothetical protein [Caudoviricetes sp.]